MKKIIVLLLSAALVIAAIYFGADFLINSRLLSAMSSTEFSAGEYSGYYYNRLTENEKMAYTAVREQIGSFPESIETPVLSSDELHSVLNALVCDDPLLFMLNTCNLQSIGSKYYFVPKYIFTQSEYEKTLAEIEKAVAEAQENAPFGSEYDMELYYHDMLINSCTYCDSGDDNCSNIVGAFIDRSATCSGYARAFKLLLDRAGIECILVTGEARSSQTVSESHMWNAAKIDGKWYFVDPTWDDPTIDGGQDEICRHNYFNISDEMLRRTHSDYTVDFVCDSTDLFYYNVNNAYFSEFNSDTVLRITELIAEAANTDKTQIDFLLTDSALTQKAVRDLFTNQKIYRALENAALQTKVKLVTDSVKYTVDDDANIVTIFFEIN